MSITKASLRVLMGALLVLIFASCEEFLKDVEPSAALPIGEGFSTLEDLELFLNGTYQALIGPRGNQFFVSTPDLTTGDATLVAGGCSEPFQFANNAITPLNGWLPDMWFVGYRTINQANVLIEKTDLLESNGTIAIDDANKIKGEAHFLRAVAFFQLVRMFAQPFGETTNENLAVPMPLMGVTAASELKNLPRATVSQLYEQIILDLDMAKDVLEGGDQVSGIANEQAAIALLAEVTFQQGDYSNTLKYTRAIIESNQFTLVSPPDDFFATKGTPEEIWSLTHTAQESGGLNFLTQGNSCNSMSLADDLYERSFDRIVTTSQKEELNINGWTVDDLRYTNLTNTDPENWRSLKYPLSDGSNNVPIIRYAQVLLMHAECLARMDDIPGAVQYLNTIRARSLEVSDDNGSLLPDDVVLFSPEDFDSTDELIDAIILERHVELLMEGKRFHDLMRLQRDVNGIPFDDCRLRWPIPQVELDANPNISQDYPSDC